MSPLTWHRLYESTIAAPAEVLFELLADMPNYSQWLPESDQFARTTEVEPYPVRLGSSYRDGRPGDASARSWQGSVTGFQRPGSLDFHHTIEVRQLRATVDVHIHYTLEQLGDDPAVTSLARWLLLDLTMPAVLRPLRPLITRPFDRENVRTLAALKAFAESGSGQTPATGS